MELVVIFAGMAMIYSSIAASGVIAEKRGYETGALANEAIINAIGFGALALIGLLFI